MLVAQTHANVKIGAAYTGLLTGFTGKTHQDVEDLAIMRAMPGMTVLAPGDATECVAAVRWATETPGPVYLRLARDAGPDLVRRRTTGSSPGRVIPLRDGTDVLIVSTGMQTARCLEAAALLEADGHLGRRPPRPLAQAGRCGGDRRGGAAASASSSASRSTRSSAAWAASWPRSWASASRAGSSGSGSQDTWGESAPNAFLLDRHGLSAERVAERVAQRSCPRCGRVDDAAMTDDEVEEMG